MNKNTISFIGAFGFAGAAWAGLAIEAEIQKPRFYSVSNVSRNWMPYVNDFISLLEIGRFVKTFLYPFQKLDALCKGFYQASRKNIDGKKVYLNHPEKIIEVYKNTLIEKFSEKNNMACNNKNKSALCIKIKNVIIIFNNN